MGRKSRDKRERQQRAREVAARSRGVPATADKGAGAPAPSGDPVQDFAATLAPSEPGSGPGEAPPVAAGEGTPSAAAQSVQVLPESPAAEPALVGRANREPALVPIVILIAAFALVFAFVARGVPAVDEFLTTRWLLGTGRLPLVVAAALLFLPTPLASARAGRTWPRVLAESLLLAAGVTTTVHALLCAELHERDDFAFMVFAAELVLAPVLRVLLAPRLLRRAIDTWLRRHPHGASLLRANSALVGVALPDGLPAALAPPVVPPAAWLPALAWLGRLHRVLHGRPTVPCIHWLVATRTNLQRAAQDVQRIVQTAGGQELPGAVARLGTAWIATLQAQALTRLVDRQAWPRGDGPPVAHEDVLLADFEKVYGLALQASLHPAGAGGETVEAVIASLDWAFSAWNVEPLPAAGAVGWLAAACRAFGDGDADIALTVAAEFAAIAQAAPVRSRAEYLAVTVLAHLLWQDGQYHCALAQLDGIEFADRLLSLPRYLRSRILIDLQEHDAALLPADRRQLRALAADDAVRAGAPELWWRADG